MDDRLETTGSSLLVGRAEDGGYGKTIEAGIRSLNLKPVGQSP